MHKSPGHAAHFIAVSGNIGAGKSSLVGFLSKRFGLRPLYEPVEDNPYLVDFYADMKHWAFHSQMFYLSRKLSLHFDAQSAEGKVVLDRTIYEDAEIFAEALHRRRVLVGRDYRTYRELYELIRGQLQPPDLMIYLRASIRTVRRRIRERGRPEEQNMPRSYLRMLHELYEGWFEAYDLGPKVVIETDELNYLTDLVDRIDLIERIEKLLAA